VAAFLTATVPHTVTIASITTPLAVDSIFNQN